MDQYVKMSIDGRKSAITGSFKLDEKAQKKVDELFSEIEKLGKECKDASEFETKFQASPLNQKYMDLFTEVATSSASKQAAGNVAASMAAGAAEGALRNAVGSAMPTRASVHQKARDVAMDVPVLGDAIDISEKAGYVGHLAGLFKKKKKDED